MNCKQLPKAKTLALLIGSVMSGLAANASASTTMYNTYAYFGSNIGTDAGLYGTDGWTATSPLPNGSAEDWEPWVGTATANTAPFGSVGDVVNWAAELTAAGDSLTVSSQDAHDRYGIWANIDTARGAWNDAGPNGPANPAAESTGWSHNTDIGLFRSTVTQQVTLQVSSLKAASGGWNNFGLTVFTGMDTNSGAYDHHGGWNVNFRPSTNASPNSVPAMLDNPLGTAGLTYLAFSDHSELSFTANAGQVYSILLGGYAGPDNYGPHDGYVVSIYSSPVPVPAAIWLFGPALAGLGIVGGRKRKPGKVL